MESLSNKEILVRLLDRTENLPAMEQDIKSIKEHLKALNGKVADHEKRIRVQENWKSYITGAVAFAVAIGIPNLVTIASAL